MKGCHQNYIYIQLYKNYSSIVRILVKTDVYILLIKFCKHTHNTPQIDIFTYFDAPLRYNQFHNMENFLGIVQNP